MWRILATLLLFSFSTLVNGQQRVPCYFIFGDSSSDVGNNNRLITMAKANYPPYGIDFPGGVPTGRFTNGRTVEDFITELLGFDRFIQPYRSTNTTLFDRDILRGVNFASGAGGILLESGSQLGDRVWMDRQLLNFVAIRLRLLPLVQGPVANYLNQCLYTVNIGSNDYINNYFMPQFYPAKRLFTPEEFAERLIDRYRTQLQALYNYGARKVAIFGLGQLGCIPAELAMNNATQCVQEINQAVNLFNTRLRSLVDELNLRLRDARYTIIDLSAFQAVTPPAPGLITNSTCCILRSDYQCAPFTRPCPDRNLYAFMDGFHPTEVVNRQIATASFSTQVPAIARPVNIDQLTGRNPTIANY